MCATAFTAHSSLSLTTGTKVDAELKHEAHNMSQLQRRYWDLLGSEHTFCSVM